MGNELTVKDLIAQLQQYPEDLEVVVDSYEDGCDPITGIKKIEIIDYPNRESHYGIYDEDYENTKNGKCAIKVFSKRRGEEATDGE